MKHVLVVIAAAVLLVPALAQQPAKPMTKAEIEEIVKEYILQHPEVLIDSVRQHQQREASNKQQRAKDALTTKQADLVADPSSPVTKSTAANPVSIVEFFDYRCGYCKRVYPTLQKILAENKDVRLVFKELPILGPESVVASKAALAANMQGKYQEFHTALMTSQTPATQASIEQTAKNLGLDVARLKKDMESPEVSAILTRNGQLAQSLGVEATPSFVIGTEMVPGAMTEEGFNQLIAKVKAKKESGGQ